MTELCYSPNHQGWYVEQGIGVQIKDDLQRWNWHYTMAGPVVNEALDGALLKHWNEYQREAMMWPPSDALEWLTHTIPNLITEDVRARLLEAQARLFAPKVAGVEGNVIYGNFKRRA